MKKSIFKIIFLAFITILSSIFITHASIKHFKPKTLNDLSNHIVGVQTGCLYENQLLEKVPKAQIEFYSDVSTMILALEQGKIDSYVTESNFFLITKRFHKALKRIKEPISKISVGYVCGEKERDKIIYEDLEEFIDSYNVDGTRKEMEDYWIKNYDPDTCTVERSGITGEKGLITVALESGYEPFSYFSNDEFSGYDVDFIYRFARKYGYKPEFLPLSFDAVAPAVASGKANLGGSIVLSNEREEGALFSSPYLNYDLIAVYFDDGALKSKGFFSSIMTSINNTFIKENRWKLFANGALVTILITLSSIIIGTILGYLLYIVCKDGNVILNNIVDTLGWIFHGIPSVLFLMILCYIVFAESALNNIIVSIIGFSILFCFSTYDMIVTGVKAVGVGQYEAARAQGFTSNQTFVFIQNPQAIYHFLPTYKNEVIALLKETSIVGYIAVQDLTKMSDIIRSRTYEAFFPLVVTALIYFLIIIVLIWVINRINPIIDISKRDVKKALKDIHMDKSNNI